MTATTSARRIITAAVMCPSWCDGHADGTDVHCRDLPGTWGTADDGPVLGLALERHDDHLGAGQARVNVQISSDGILVDDGLLLGLAAAEDYAVTILRLVAVGRAAA